MPGYERRAVVEWHQHYASLSSFIWVQVVGIPDAYHLNINEISEDLERLIVEKCPIYTDYTLNFKLVVSPKENGVWEARLYCYNSTSLGSHFIATIDVSSLPSLSGPTREDLHDALCSDFTASKASNQETYEDLIKYGGFEGEELEKVKAFAQKVSDAEDVLERDGFGSDVGFDLDEAQNEFWKSLPYDVLVNVYIGRQRDCCPEWRDCNPFIT